MRTDYGFSSIKVISKTESKVTVLFKWQNQTSLKGSEELESRSVVEVYHQREKKNGIELGGGHEVKRSFVLIFNIGQNYLGLVH